VGRGEVSRWGGMNISDTNFLADVTSFSKHFIFTYKLCHDAMIYSQKFQHLLLDKWMQLISKEINFCPALFVLNKNLKFVHFTKLDGD